MEGANESKQLNISIKSYVIAQGGVLAMNLGYPRENIFQKESESD